MKICFLINSLDEFGGTAHVTSIIANNLSYYHYEIFILVLYQNGKPKFHFDKKIKIFYIFKQPVSLFKNYIKTIIYLRSLIKKANITILIVVESTLYLYPITALLNLPVAILVWEHFNFHASLGNWKRKLSRYLAKRYADVIVTLTHRDRKFWLIDGNAHVNIEVIPNPVPFNPVKIIFSINSKKVISIGRLTMQKGFDSLIKAWIELNTRFGPTDWTLHIIGDGIERCKLQNQINNVGFNKQIILEPSTSNVRYWYQSAGIYCLSSRFEGLPIVLLEAMGYGIPIVSFDCETGPRDIIENGKNGILVTSNDIISLANALNTLMTNNQLRSQYSKTAFETCVDNYTISHIIKQWICLLQKLKK